MASYGEIMFRRGLIIVLYASSVVWAQAQISTATLSGTVTNEAGMPLAGVQITLRYLNSGNNWSEITGEEGKFRVTALPLGSYLLTASLTGFKTDVRGVPLRTRADEVVVDFTLEAEESSGRVVSEVSAVPAELQSREPINEPAPNPAPTRNSITPEAQTSPPPIAQPAANQLDSSGTQAAGYSVQVAAFRSRPKAEELQGTLQDGGYPVIVVEVEIPGSGRYYRVRVGPFVFEQEAREAASNLRSRFPQRISAFWIVPPQP